MQNKNTKTSRPKAFLGGLIAVGIFASFFAFNGGSTPSEQLAADVIEAETSEPTIIAIEPTTASSGEIVSIVIENLDNLTRGTGGVFFNETLVEIETIDESADGTLTVFVRVPDLIELDNYKIKITTPSEVIISSIEFKLTDLNELAPPPPNETVKPTEETPSESSFEGATIEEMFREANPKNKTITEITETPTRAKVLPTAPVFAGEAPRNLNATLISRGIELSWEAPAGNIDHFNIYYGTTSGKYIHRTQSQDIFEVLNSNFINDARYYFMVSAVFADNSESTGSNETAAVYSNYVAAPSTQLIQASTLPTKLSEEGPAETLAVAIFIALGFSGFLFRRKIFIRK